MIRGMLVSVVLISSGEMESAWQQCRVRCHWLADLTPITTNPLPIPPLFFFFPPRSHPIPYESLLPFSLILFLSSHNRFLLPPSFIYPFVFDYFFPSLLCIFGNKHPGKLFLDSGHLEEIHQKWLVCHIFALLRCLESETLISVQFF